jgi:hypothetical protein
MPAGGHVLAPAEAIHPFLTAFRLEHAVGPLQPAIGPPARVDHPLSRTPKGHCRLRVQSKPPYAGVAYVAPAFSIANAGVAYDSGVWQIITPFSLYRTGVCLRVTVQYMVSLSDRGSGTGSLLVPLRSGI